MSKPKILWVSDAAVMTGFATVTHNILGWLGSQWERVALGVNTVGDILYPNPYPYTIYNARAGGDFWGFKRFAEIIRKEQPSVVVIQSDAWIVETFVEIMEQIPDCPPVVAYLPVDGQGMKRSTARELSKLALSIFYTQFGEEQARKAGFTGRSAAINLGVRHDTYKPCATDERRQFRAKLLPEVPADAFVIGNVNRNQPRKRLDLTIAVFADFLRRGGKGVLYLHCLNEDIGWDLREVADWYGVGDLLYMPRATSFDELWPETVMRQVYCSLDVQISTTLGEGFGLPTLEGMACGAPQIVPEWAALGEWPRGAVRYVPVHPGVANVGYRGFAMGAEPDRAACVEALFEVWRKPEYRRALALASVEHAAQQRFTWKDVAQRFHTELIKVVGAVAKAAA